MVRQRISDIVEVSIHVDNYAEFPCDHRNIYIYIYIYIDEQKFIEIRVKQTIWHKIYIGRE